MSHQTPVGLPKVPSLSHERESHIRACRLEHEQTARFSWRCVYGGASGCLVALVGYVYLLAACGEFCLSITVALAAAGWHFGARKLMDMRWAKYEQSMRLVNHVFCPACRAHFSSLMPWHCRRCHTVNQDDNRHSFLWACQNCHVRPAALLCPRCKSLVMLQDGDHDGDIASVPADTTLRDQLAAGALALPNGTEPHSPTPSAVSDRIAEAIRKAKAGQL